MRLKYLSVEGQRRAMALATILESLLIVLAVLMPIIQLNQLNQLVKWAGSTEA